MNKLQILLSWQRVRRMPAEPDALEKALRNMVAVAVILLMGVAGANLGRDIRRPQTLLNEPVVDHVSALVPPPSARKIAKRIAAQHWFGIALTKNYPPKKAPVKTAGPVKLLGIIFSANNARLSRVIFALNENQKSYSIGTTLSNGDEIVGIEADQVILTDGARRYALVLNHPGSAMLAKAPHFNSGEQLKAAIARRRSPPATTRQASSAAPALTGTTFQRLQALRARLLSGSPH